MERIPVTHLIIAGGSEADLFECLLSLCETAYSPCETLVVDNSPDGLAEALAVSFPRAKAARPERPLTFAEAVNFGFQRATAGGAKAVFLLNDDVTVHPEALSVLVEAASGEPGVFAPEIHPYEGGPRKRFRLDWGKRLIVSEAIAPGAGGGPIDYAEGAAALIFAEVFDRIGGFDEEFGFYFEDADFSVRARQTGYAVREVAGARVWHKGSVSTGRGLSPFKAYWRARNTLKFARKHRGKARLPVNAAYHFGAFVIPQSAKAAAGMCLGRRRDARVLAAIARGTWDFLTGNGHMMRVSPPLESEADARAVMLLREIL